MKICQKLLQTTKRRIQALSGLVNLSDLSHAVRLAAAFDPAGFLPFTLTLGWLGGGSGREFTWYTGGNAFSASVEVRFEF